MIVQNLFIYSRASNPNKIYGAIFDVVKHTECIELSDPRNGAQRDEYTKSIFKINKRKSVKFGRAISYIPSTLD